MPGVSPWTPYVCVRCLQIQSRQLKSSPQAQNVRRKLHPTRPTLGTNDALVEKEKDGEDNKPRDVREAQEGAMSRRLKEMTDQSIEEGGRTAQKAVEEAGFSQELKERLEARILDSKFKNENPTTFSLLNLPSTAGKGTRDIAAAQAWTGTENLEDAALRMLQDAHKPLHGNSPPRIPKPRMTSLNVDMRMKKAVQKSKGERLANARDKTSIYALSQDTQMSEKERKQMKEQLKERFTSGARHMPTTVQGLAALANERIENAIARGQFKNIPRGKGKNIERDYNASSPFLDTTEYFMNKIIQKQEIVPPWIEKQQEVVKGAATFRGRLRNDWKRHAARVIASKGGSLEAQVKRAEAYAAAEAIHNPRKRLIEALNEVDTKEEVGQVTVVEAPASAEDASITVAESTPTLPDQDTTTEQAWPQRPDSTTTPRLFPFRDPAWESLELPYHTLALSSLNSLTRSYNLMAPALAQKPYFGLQRELQACFADIAPQLPAEIRARARAPERIKVEAVGHRRGGVLEKFGGESVKVWDDRRKPYGFREFWGDLLGR